jgi:hypothetical protein
MGHPDGGRLVLLRELSAGHGPGILRVGTVGRAKLLDDGSGRAFFTAWTGQWALVATADLRVFDPATDEDTRGAVADSE